MTEQHEVTQEGMHAEAYRRVKQELDKIVSMASNPICAVPIGNGIRVADPSYSSILRAARQALSLLPALMTAVRPGTEASVRLEFEEWALDQGYSIYRIPGNPYYYEPTTEAAWEDYEDARAAGGASDGNLSREYEEQPAPEPEKTEVVNLTTSDSSTLLDVLRQEGWMVAVHNDYRLNGDLHTFWLFTRGDQCVKGEGRTDKDALVEVFRALPSQRDDSGLVKELELARDAVQAFNPSLAGAQRIGFNKAIAIVKAALVKVGA